MTLLNLFEPVLGNSFTILETIVGNVAGTFDAENLPLFNGLTLDVVYNSQSVVLEVVESADRDGDGDVDGGDFLLIQRTDPSLISQWESEFGTGVGPLASSRAVPEPTTILLLVGGIFLPWLADIIRIPVAPPPKRVATARHLNSHTKVPRLFCEGAIPCSARC